MPFRAALTIVALALCAACSHLPELPQMPNLGGPSATPGLSPRERVSVAIELLGAGDHARAETELRAALDEDPNHRAAQMLLQQITDDPRALLGEQARPYTVRQGETMSALAERFLGDPLLFYALARYNDLAAPDELAAGRRLMIPHRRRAVASAPAPTQPAAAAALEAPRALDPARASQLRLQGLQQLNTGNVEAAVALLRQAQTLDESNAAIQRDLDRALRLQAALGGVRG